MRILYLFLFAFILLADALVKIPFINYWDEAAIVVAPVCAMLTTHGKLISNNKNKIRCFILFLLLIIGLLGNMFSPGIQVYDVAIFKDIIAFIKFPIVMISLNYFSNSYSTHVKCHKDAIWSGTLVSKVYIILASIGIFVGTIFDFGFYTGEIRIFDCYQFIYSHPTFFVSSTVICIVMLIESGMKKNIIYILLGCILIFLAQRFKGYAFIVFCVLFLIVRPSLINKLFSYTEKTRIRKKYIIPIIFVAIAIIYAVFYRRFSTYLEWGMSSARIALYVVGGLIFLDKFPLGSGFGTFASFLSGRYYSNIYILYDISSVDGLRPDKYNYMSDTFWPWIYGQLGILGLIGYIFLIIDFIKRQLEKLIEYDHIIAFILIWIYALLASAMEAYFTNGSGISMAVVLNIFIGTDSKGSLEKVKNPSKEIKHQACTSTEQQSA